MPHFFILIHKAFIALQQSELVSDDAVWHYSKLQDSSTIMPDGKGFKSYASARKEQQRQFLDTRNTCFIKDQSFFIRDES